MVCGEVVGVSGLVVWGEVGCEWDDGMVYGGGEWVGGIG